MNAWKEFVDWFRSLMAPEPPGGGDELQTLRPRVLLINFDPRQPSKSRQPLSRYMKQYLQMDTNDVDDLVDGFIADVRECSNGLVDYQVVQSIVVDGWPVKKQDGFHYTWDTFIDCLKGKSPWFHPDMLDYDLVVSDFGLLHRVERGQIDEVWLFGSGYAGFWESIMGGPGAFECNSLGVIHAPGVSRRFVIMGFNWERGVGEMLESLGHRVEACLKRTWESRQGDENLWARFTRYGPHAVGGANVGSIHHAPNSPSDKPNDHVWASTNSVVSNCDDWLNFPNFQGTTRVVSRSEWGCEPSGPGDAHAHHKWWFKHLPKAPGKTLGIANNWWLYGIDPNAVP